MHPALNPVFIAFKELAAQLQGRVDHTLSFKLPYQGNFSCQTRNLWWPLSRSLRYGIRAAIPIPVVIFEVSTFQVQMANFLVSDFYVVIHFFVLLNLTCLSLYCRNPFTWSASDQDFNCLILAQAAISFLETKNLVSNGNYINPFHVDREWILTPTCAHSWANECWRYGWKSANSASNPQARNPLQLHSVSGSFPKPTTKSNELPPSQHFWQNPNPDFTSLIYTPLSSLDATFKADRNTILAIVETRVDNPEDSPEHQAHRPQSESNGTSSLQSWRQGKEWCMLMTHRLSLIGPIPGPVRRIGFRSYYT